MHEKLTPDDPDEARLAHLHRLEQARQLLDEVEASLPEGHPVRVAIERGRAKEPPR